MRMQHHHDLELVAVSCTETKSSLIFHHTRVSPMAPYVQQGDSLESFLRSFWQRQIATSEEETPDFKHPPLPLARIKKVMKSDPDVKVGNPSPLS